MPQNCISFGCPNTSSKSSDISFHRLPLKNKKLLAKWIIKIRRTNTPVNEHVRICSEHFEPSCFLISYNGRKMLRKDAIPTKFSFTKPTKERAPPKQRLPLREKTNTCEILSKESDHDKGGDSSLPSEIRETVSVGSVLDVDVLQQRINALEAELNNSQVNLRQLLVDREGKKFCVENLAKDDKLFKFYTGFSYSQFQACFEFFGESVSCLRYKGTSDYEQEGQVAGSKRGPSRTLSPVNEFLLVLTRLKVGLLEQDIAARFQLHQSTVSRIITTWISFMYAKFKELDIWPSRKQCNENMPEHVRNLYPELRCIIDATEIYIEKPSNPTAQQATFSVYKNRNTLKALIGIGPSGSLTFISDLYGGSISDRELTIKCGILEKDWERKDILMADRGFTIQDLFEQKGVRVNIPPFLNGKPQLSENELMETRRIATIRIHVERAIERIKNYHILDFSPVSMCQNKLVDQVFYVCAMLTNFQPPLIS